MKRLTLLGTVAFTVLFIGVAHASTSVSWTGGQDQGSENLPARTADIGSCRRRKGSRAPF